MLHPFTNREPIMFFLTVTDRLLPCCSLCIILSMKYSYANRFLQNLFTGINRMAKRKFPNIYIPIFIGMYVIKPRMLWMHRLAM